MTREDQNEKRKTMLKQLLLAGFLILSSLSIPLYSSAEEAPAAEPPEMSQENAPLEEAVPMEAKEEPSEIDRWHGRVTVGGGGVRLDEESFKFAEYDRIPDDGFFFVGDADLHFNRKDYHMDFLVEDLGLENRHLSLKSGRYGRYEILLDYDETIRRSSNTSQTPFHGAGGGNLTLPAGFVTGARTQDLLTLQSSLKEVDLEVKRKAATAGYSYVVGLIQIDLSFKREYKEGIGSLGGVVGTNGGDARSIILPEPIDYITDDIKASVSYGGERSQAELVYHYSQFNNREETLRWSTPFDVHFNPPTFTFEPYQSPMPSTGFQARHQLYPDNQAHNLHLTGGINFPYATRVTAWVGLGQMKQNENLLPFSTSTDTSLLPRRTSDAEIDTRLLWLKVASRPLSRLSLDAQYRNYTTKNKMPRDLFLYVKTDNVLGTQADIASVNAHYSLPYDWAQEQMKLDAAYYLATGTSVKAGYDIDTIERDYREINKTRENTVRAGLRSTYFSKAHIGLNASSGVRKGVDDYDQAKLFNEIHSTEYINTIADPALRFQNHPQLRKFDIADRDRAKYGAQLTTFPHETTTVGFHYNRIGDDYDGSVLGLQNRDDRSVTVDVSVTPLEVLSVYGYYTRQQIDIRQAGRNFEEPPEPGYLDPNRNWRIDQDDRTDTFGAGVNVSLMENRVILGALYSVSKSNIAIGVTAGPALPPAADLPDLTTELHSVELSGQYRVTERLSVGASFLYESYRSDDFATDGIAPGSATIPTVVTLSGSVPDYRAQVAVAYLTMEF